MPATNELLREGRYRISQRTAGNGNVFEAYDTVRNTNVIVREIPIRLNKVTTLSQQESLRLAFANQAKALTEIDHESLLHVHDFFSEIDRQYLVMEAVDGDELGSLLSRNKKAFSVSEVTKWADELLDALNYIHTHKPSIIHRNIRPQNLKLHPSGKIKLLGVGLESGSDSDLTGGVNDENLNLRYSPIEQIWPGLDAASQKAITNNYDDRSERILKEPLDARSDIYSLGATLYFLITGREPVDPLERSIDILEGKLDPLSEPSKVHAQIPSEISDVLMKALEIKRENRYDSALIMRQVLKTSIARVLEREEEQVPEQAAAQWKANPAAEEEKRRDAEAEQHRQEALQQQHREAEEQRVLAEQRETEAERLLAEQQLAEAERLLAEKQAAEAERLLAEQQLAEAERLLAEQQLAEAERLLAEQQAAEAERMLAEKQAAEAERMRAEKQAAEAERMRAEKQAAEAERMLAEKQAAEADALPRSVDNLLEVPVSAEVRAHRDIDVPDEDELAAVLEELAEAEAVAVKKEWSERKESAVEADQAEDADDAEIQVLEARVDLAPQSTEAYEDDDEDIISVPEKSGFSLPVPAIAGAVALIVVIAIGGWFAMSGSSEPEKSTVQPVQVNQPPAESNTVAEPIVVSTQPDPEAVPSSGEAMNEQAVAVAKTGPSPKPKKAEPAKPRGEKKKAVTVDDLINDN